MSEIDQHMCHIHCTMYIYLNTDDGIDSNDMVMELALCVHRESEQKPD